MYPKVQADSLLIYNTIITTIQKKIIPWAYSTAMNLIEKTVSLLAPHTCIMCRREGLPLCKDCATTKLILPYFRCYQCELSLSLLTPCPHCSRQRALQRVWSGLVYENTIKEAIALLKFNRTKAMAEPLAEWLSSYLPTLPKDTFVTHVPTVHSRIRLRGYDQAQLIAKLFAKKQKLTYVDILRRAKSTRQVGASRNVRFKQLQGAFAVHKPKGITAKHILLIDDVLTTGATLESAAAILQLSGVTAIDAAVVAHAPASSPTAMFSSSTRNE